MDMSELNKCIDEVAGGDQMARKGYIAEINAYLDKPCPLSKLSFPAQYIIELVSAWDEEDQIEYNQGRFTFKDFPILINSIIK